MVGRLVKLVRIRQVVSSAGVARQLGGVGRDVAQKAIGAVLHVTACGAAIVQPVAIAHGTENTDENDRFSRESRFDRVRITAFGSSALDAAGWIGFHPCVEKPVKTVGFGFGVEEIHVFAVRYFVGTHLEGIVDCAELHIAQRWGELLVGQIAGFADLDHQRNGHLCSEDIVDRLRQPEAEAGSLAVVGARDASTEDDGVLRPLLDITILVVGAVVARAKVIATACANRKKGQCGRGQFASQSLRCSVPIKR